MLKGIKHQNIFTKYQPNMPSIAKDEIRGEYAGRRVMMYNLSLKRIVNLLSNYGQSQTLIYDSSEFVKDELYCLDMIFEDKNAPQRSQLALDFLVKKFPEKIKTKSENVKGYVLELGNKTKIPEVAEKNVEFVSTATTQDLAQKLSRLMQVPVKNGVNYNHRFILTMSKIPNEMSTINLILSRIGLVLAEKEFTRNLYTVN